MDNLNNKKGLKVDLSPTWKSNEGKNLTNNNLGEKLADPDLQFRYHLLLGVVFYGLHNIFTGYIKVHNTA